MICQRCGRDNAPNILYCQGCGTPMPAEQSTPAYAAYPQAMYGPTNYSGIGSRFLAALMDGIILGVPIGIISSVLSAMMAVRVINQSGRDPYGITADAVGTFFAGFGFIMIISLLITWAYFAMMESSGWQGTIGKRIMGIKVTDLDGNRISLGKATIRVAVKAFLSGWFLIGYILAFFTQRKQALHDLIAGTLVLTKQAYPAPMGYQPQNPQYPAQQAYQPPQPQVYAQPSACPYCGNGLQPNSRFCSNCGRNL